MGDHRHSQQPAEQMVLHHWAQTCAVIGDLLSKGETICDDTGVTARSWTHSPLSKHDHGEGPHARVTAPVILPCLAHSDFCHHTCHIPPVHSGPYKQGCKSALHAVATQPACCPPHSCWPLVLKIPSEHFLALLGPPPATFLHHTLAMT